MSGSDGLLVANVAILQGTGTINLASGSVLAYDSSQTSEFDGTITGAGELQVGTSSSTGVTTLILGGQNTYAGGTDVQNGTLKLAKNPTSGAGALLGTGAVTIGSDGILDLNGCPLTLNSMSGEGTIKDTVPACGARSASRS